MSSVIRIHYCTICVMLLRWGERVPGLKIFTQAAPLIRLGCDAVKLRHRASIFSRLEISQCLHFQGEGVHVEFP
jgi:hypothetical protein